MKLLATLFLFLFASTSFAQATIKTDTLVRLDSTTLTDSTKSASATPIPGPDALGHCVMLPSDLEPAHGGCWRRHP